LSNLDIKIREGADNMDFEKVAEMLGKTLWSPGIKTAEVKTGAEHSALVIGAFCGDIQVGYARVVSDIIKFAYIADVYVDENYRHNGIATQMLRYILSHESMKRIYRWYLRSAANELYEKVGFVMDTDPSKWMEIRKPNPYIKQN